MATPLESFNEDMVLILSEKLRACNANFRVIANMSTKINELQDDLRSLKTKKEIETPVSPPIIPQVTIPTDSDTNRRRGQSAKQFGRFREQIKGYVRAREIP